MKAFAANNRIAGVVASLLVVLMIGFAAHANGAQTAPQNAPFDHSKTGFLLKDVHTTLKCEQCHVEGIFKNTPKVCSGCHTTGTRVAATPKPINHVPTSSECDTCHVSAANFLVKSYKHLGITGGCATCHNGQYLGVVSKPPTHFPTQLPCEACHTNTSSFIGQRMDHTGITGGCYSCHGGPAGEPGPIASSPNVVSYNPSIHIPLGSPPPDCNTCHTNFISFLGARYDHLNVAAGTCGNCHKGQYPNVTSINPATHIGGVPAAACDTCHKGYASFLGATYSHVGVTAACSTCHSGQYAGVVSINPSVHIPLPSGTTCDTCHTNALTGLPGSMSPTFSGVVFHQNAVGNPPTGTCTSCHSGSYISQNASGKGAAHVPTTADCATCHTNTSSYTTFAGATFSHAGVAAGTCGTCHQGQYGSVVSINTAMHIPQSSGNACDKCHTASISGLGTATPTFLGVMFHQNPLGNPPTGSCSTCHSGAYLSQNAQAKNLGHVPTTSDCKTCHINTAGYTTFLGASFSHSPGTYASFPAAAPATPTCSSCHNGSIATGKVSTHVVTTGDCLVCHTNSTTGCPNCTSFYGVQYDHSNASTGVAAYTTFPTAGSTPSPRCDSCHGSTALGKSAGHIPTTADCMTCHTPASTGCGSTGLCSTFLGASFSHAGIAAGTCGTCHQGQYASVVSINPAVHIPQSSGNACDTCHTNALTGLPGSMTPTFNGVVFHKNALGNPPSGTCTTCHSGAYVSQNAQAKISGHVITTSDCVSCHTAANTGGYTTFLGASFAHSPGTYAAFPSAAPASPLCGSCHNGTTAKGKSAGHIATTADCISCHTNGSTGCPNCSTFLGAGASPHTAANGYSGSCVSCHNGTVATGTSANPSHIPIGGIDCGQCHSAYDGAGSFDFSTSASASAGMYAGVTKYTMNHTGLTGTCASCHNGSYASQGIYGAQGKVTNHIPTAIVGSADCTSCHKAYGFSNFAITSGVTMWQAPANETMNHNNAQGGAPNYCVTCHLSGTTYLVPSGFIRKSHNGASTSKDCSSSNCHRPLGRIGTPYSSWN